ncbi:MAG: hypothetical protein CMP28_13485 [Roseibacillus sp.]|nr:hypothetical protein [Roseibacillus sp.]
MAQTYSDHAHRLGASFAAGSEQVHSGKITGDKMFMEREADEALDGGPSSQVKYNPPHIAWID